MKKRLIPPPLRRPRRTGGKPGAPFGNSNALKHGNRTRARRALRAAIREHIRKVRKLVEALRSLDQPALSSPAERERHGFGARTKKLSSPAEQAKRSEGKGIQVVGTNSARTEMFGGVSQLPDHAS